MRRTRTKIALSHPTSWFHSSISSSSSRQRQRNRHHYHQQQQGPSTESCCLLSRHSTATTSAVFSSTPTQHAFSSSSSSTTTNTLSSIDHTDTNKTRSSSLDTDTSSTDIWRGATNPFSDYAEHVQVSKDDLPVSIASAILRSMRTVGAQSRSPFSSSDNRVLIIDDDNDEKDDDGTNNQEIIQQEYPYLTTTTAINIAAQVQDHPPGRPMTPKQLLYLGAVWYLSATDYQRNQENHQIIGNEENNTTRTNRSGGGTGGRIVKPIRLSLGNATQLLAEGDYLRIHHTPRRFPQVYQADWSFPTASLGNTSNTIDNNTNEDENHRNNNNHNDDNNVLPLVVQQEGLGYCIIEKPSLIPVHATVDNVIENVVHQLVLSKQQQQQQQFIQSTTHNDDYEKGKETPYFASVQRLDIHTSGLLVIATTPEFAAYFSKLLRYKTKHRNNNYSNTNKNTNNRTKNKSIHHKSNESNSLIGVGNTTATVLYDNTNNTRNSNNSSNNNNNSNQLTVEKGYKCLVCLQATKEESIIQAWTRLSELSSSNDNSNSNSASNNNNNNTINIIQHYLKVSDRSHKIFVDQIPTQLPNNNNNNTGINNNEKGDNNNNNNNYSDIDNNNDDGEGNQNSKWLECLMVITHVSAPIPLFFQEEKNNDRNTTSLADHLWPTRSMGVPTTATKAVVEVQVNLITGRTHQIRGQLSHLGFPIVGDEHYGGGCSSDCATATTTVTTVTTTREEEDTEDEEDHQQEEETLLPSSQEVQFDEQPQQQQQQLLALQCCSLGFPEAEYDWVWNNKKRKEIRRGRLPPDSDARWVHATLEKAWWSPYLEKYQDNNSTTANNGVVSSDIDYQTIDDNDDDNDNDKNDEISDTLLLSNNNDTATDININTNNFRPELLPPSVQLSPGRHKYIVAKLRDPPPVVVNDGTSDIVVQSSIPPRKVRWFVSSAASQDCGGPYHVNVAQQLVEWIQCVPGYESADVVITGGGRIEYNPPPLSSTATATTVRVYGFSYRYGKGDHKRVATMIQDSLRLGTTANESTTTTVVTYDDSDELY